MAHYCKLYLHHLTSTSSCISKDLGWWKHCENHSQKRGMLQDSVLTFCLRSFASELGAVELVLSAMKAHSDAPGVQGHCAGTLTHLAAGIQERQLIFDYSGLDVVPGRVSCWNVSKRLSVVVAQSQPLEIQSEDGFLESCFCSAGNWWVFEHKQQLTRCTT